MNDPIRPTTVNATSPLLPSQNSSRQVLAPDMQKKIENQAEADGMRGKRNNDIPTLKEFYADTEEASIRFHEENTPDIGLIDFVRVYEGIYIPHYLKAFSVTQDGAEVFFRENATRDIRNAAKEDRRSDNNKGINRSPHAIEYQGAIRIHHLRGGNPLVFDIEAITTQVPIYKATYFEDEREDRWRK